MMTVFIRIYTYKYVFIRVSMYVHVFFQYHDCSDKN
jgi:hypothetical protein